MSDDRSLEELLADGYRAPSGFGSDQNYADTDDYVLGQVAVLLQQKGLTQAAALMLDVQGFEREWVNSWEYAEQTGIWLVMEADANLIDMFTEERMSEILEGFREIADGGMGWIERLRIRPSKPQVGQDWRKQLSSTLTSDVTNQARRTRLQPEAPREDGLSFSNKWELGVYRVLKKKQASLPPNATIGIVPLAGARLPERTLEPDFLITYKGRAGILEVDGPHHAGSKKRANDLSRDGQFRAAGVAYIDRLDVRDVDSEKEVEQFVDAFLARMLDHR